MKRFDLIKTVQLVFLILITACALIVIFQDTSLYQMIAHDVHVRLLAILLWVLLGGSFFFLLHDFSSYSDMRRENMELDNAIYSDALTGIANRYSVDVYIQQFLDQPLPDDMGCVTLEITNLTQINEQRGHAGGDAAIQMFSEILQQAGGGQCFIGRNGGNKFLAIFRDCSHQKLDHFLASVQQRTDALAASHPEQAIAYTAGAAFQEGKDVRSLTELVALSDRRAAFSQE